MNCDLDTSNNLHLFYMGVDIKASKLAALEKIKAILDKGNVDQQFEQVSGRYYSSDKFIVSWNAMYKGMLCEYSVDKLDASTGIYLGYKAILAVRNLFLEKQLKDFPSIEYGLIYTGMQLCPKPSRQAFFDQYAAPFNERIKKIKDERNASK